MIKKRSSVMLVTIGMLGMILLSGCGAGTGGDDPAPTPLPPGTTVAASIQLLVGNPQLDSDVVGAPTVTLTAIVKDSSNRALSGKEVSFSADSGLLAVTSGTTDASGMATATLAAGGDPTNRVIHLTASTGSVPPATNTVTVTGTNLSISGAASLSSGDSTPLTIFLKDSKGKGISDRTVAVTSVKGNNLSAATYMTNASGQVICNVTAMVGGADKITASAIGATKDFDLMVNTTILRFITPSPAAVNEVPIGTNQSVTVEYVNGTDPQAGVTVNFVTTRGVLSSSSATTGADGKAAVTVSSTNSGPASLVAAVAGGPTSQVTVEFVAPTASKMDLQASPSVIGTNSGGLTTERSLITATVRDVNDNLVKNKTVTFTIVTDASAGSLSPASAITDSFGSAGTYFIAGASSGGLGGVTIRASVIGTTVTATTTLTVAKKALFISLATGPTITKIDPNKYQKDYVALVTDSAGNPVSGATIVSTVTPVNYQKGYFTGTYRTQAGVTTFIRWVPVVTLEAASSTLPGIPACANEDGMLHNPLYDYNGILDPGEDQNGNNRLDPGNVASVTTATTDSTGHGTVSIVYARDYAYWVNVRLEAFANDLKGSTASAAVTFGLPGAGEDYVDEKIPPPGQPSPFGTSTSCYVDLTVTPVTSSQMAISWQRSPTADHYHVYRNGINIANTTQNNYIDTGLASGTQYCYQIRTVDATGTESSFTNAVCNSTFVLSPPGITVTALSSSKIQVSWTAAPGASGYRVYRNTDTLPLTSVASTSFVDTGLSADTSYCYAVSSFNAAGESAKTSQLCATTRAAGPPTPLGLKATGSAGPPPKVTLTWLPSAGATSYRIYRDGARISPTFAGSQATDTAVATQVWYCYTISAVDASGNESEQSAPQCTSTGTVALPTPTNLKATGSLGPPMKVTLTWTSSAGAARYKIYRDGVLISPTFAGSQATDTAGLTTNTWYCYAISAVDSSDNESARSDAVCTSIGPAVLTTPTGLTGTPNETPPPRVTLTWNPSPGAASYRIYRNGTFLQSPTAAPAADMSVAALTLYCYTVSAVDSAGNESAKSDQVCITTGPASPATPTNLKATPAGPGVGITLTWTASPGAVTYRIYRGDGTVLALPAGTGVFWTDTAVAATVRYCYTISAVDALGNESAQSDPQCATAMAPLGP